ncbi:PAS domain S-box protein [Duganella sp. SAP-35]|uniref:histidine kinase n=2 Tax=Duganella aceris TaxID=2703883 RepID=A0ABX0FVY1_9BURK|nr:PAS domain S-box protein [Duganella aceris]
MITEPKHDIVVEAERLRLFISSVTDYAIYMLSAEGIVSSWNAGAQRFKGYSAEEIIGQHFSRFYTDEDRAAGRPAFALHSALTEGKFEDEGWRVRKDGTRFWASVLIDPIRDERGVLLGFTKITRDVTDRRKALEALHASEERFRLLVQGVTDYAIYMLSHDGLVTNWNEGARRIKGYVADEVVGSHFSRFYTEEDQRAGLPTQALQQAREQGRFEKEGWRVRKGGERFWAHVVIDPIYDTMGELIGYAKVTRDVTERRQAEENLARAKDALHQSQKLEAIGKLTGGIAHDFNNLLSVIVSSIELLRHGVDRDAQLKIIAGMERAANRGANLTQQLLSFARQQPLKPTRMNLNRTLSSFEAMLRRAIPSSLELKLHLGANVPDIMADVTQLEAAVLNLVVNARDAVGAVGADGLITVLVDVVDSIPEGTLRQGRYVRLRVRDNGSGMSPDVAQRAVEPFFTTKEVGKGTGLGLSQAYGLAQQAGGDLRITSTLGEGTEISLYFPALVASVENGFTTHADAMEKVLVVDDQPEVLEVAVHLFKSLGYDVLPANNGPEALDLMHRHPDIAILFSDVVMPGMSGIELAERAAQHQPALKILLTSGYAAATFDEHAGELAQYALINKPYRLSDIIKQLKALH